jgi:alpha-mannosidase
MTLRRTSILLPCPRLDHFPTHLVDAEAAGLLAAWTTLWHPALIAATGRLPGWHPADNPPEPDSLAGELVIVPPISRQHLAGDWLDRMRATAPANPPPVETTECRRESIAAALAAASIDHDLVALNAAADFLALGYAHLQVELLTRAMRYSTVLDEEQFSNAVVAAAQAAVASDDKLVHDELARAFDLLADARNHVYAVDFYVVDVTLLASSTLGAPLREKLACGSPTSLLITGELIEQIDGAHPDTLAELKRAIATGTACIVGGFFHGNADAWGSPETVLRELEWGRDAAQKYLQREYQVFAQFDAAFSPLLPEILAGSGFRAALHASFDGGRLPRADQCKTRWGESDGAWLEALSTTPLDAARPETWLTFAERVGDTLAHDHVATLLLASWPGQHSDYFDDLRNAARYNSVLGKLVTLEEYFRVSRETDDWVTFNPHEYPSQTGWHASANPLSTSVDSYRCDISGASAGLYRGFKTLANAVCPATTNDAAKSAVILNPWNFACTRIVGADPIERGTANGAVFVPDVPGCGYALLDGEPSTSGTPLADGRVLRNELLELTVSETSGGIQSLRTYRDRGTRVSQRLVFESGPPAHTFRRVQDDVATNLRSQMVADRVDVTHNDQLLGEITSQGRLLDRNDQLLAHFTQSIRIARGSPAAIVSVELEPERLPDGELWRSYYASRLAWLDEAATFRRGAQWLAKETSREQIESPEWVEIASLTGNIVCFGQGLPFHRRVGLTWLDTLLCVAGESRRRFHFAIGLDCTYPTQTALSLMPPSVPEPAQLPFKLTQPRGWFLHLGAHNLIITHLEPLDGERSGIRCRILETEGRGVESTLAAYRPFLSAQITDFRGTASEVLSVVNGVVRFDIAPHRWIQLEAEW